jgi:DNA repair exonuclease SbcCD ATPase subunit
VIEIIVETAKAEIETTDNDVLMGIQQFVDNIRANEDEIMTYDAFVSSIVEFDQYLNEVRLKKQVKTIIQERILSISKRAENASKKQQYRSSLNAEENQLLQMYNQVHSTMATFMKLIIIFVQKYDELAQHCQNLEEENNQLQKKLKAFQANAKTQNDYKDKSQALYEEVRE